MDYLDCLGALEGKYIYLFNDVTKDLGGVSRECLRTRSEVGAANISAGADSAGCLNASISANSQRVGHAIDVVKP
jgi:hypothetical protein